MTAQYSLFLDPLQSAVNAREIETTTRDRVFVPLAKAPFHWFASGHKSWELRRRGRQYTQKHLVPGRRVELRLGYSDRSAALWGRIAEVLEADSLSQFFDAVDFKEVIPEAVSRAEAMETAAGILGADAFPVIGFCVSRRIRSLNFHYTRTVMYRWCGQEKSDQLSARAFERSKAHSPIWSPARTGCACS